MPSFPSTSLSAEELTGTVHAALTKFVEAASKSKTKFPGPNPVSIERKDFANLKRDFYWAAPKTDGIRAGLVCLRVGEIDYVAFMDRSKKLYAFHGRPFQICTAWFQGTLLDGELIGTDFLIFDAAMVSGVNVMHIPFSERRSAVDHGLAMHLQAQNEVPPVRMFLKQFFHPREFCADMAREKNVDGIILMPENQPYIIGRHTALFKLKTSHTIDFVLCEGNQLAVLDRGNLKHVDKLASTGHAIPLPAVGSIVECKLIGGAWTCILHRDDKTHPNDSLTYRNTLKNIKENITYEELLSFVNCL